MFSFQSAPFLGFNQQYQQLKSSGKAIGPSHQVQWPSRLGIPKNLQVLGLASKFVVR